MSFNSYQFLIFFPAVVLLYYLIPCKWRKNWLLFVSYCFYMSWSPKYALLLFTATVVTWISACAMERTDKRNIKKYSLIGTVALLLFILFLFKYFVFTWNTIRSGVSFFGGTLGECPMRFVLPVGISFYTFQVLGYLIDVYRGKIAAEKNFLRYALFAAFFPQLAAGPISRFERLMPQLDNIERPMSVNWYKIRDGLIYMLYGYFIKMVLADNLAVYVDRVYGRYYFYGTIELVIAMLFFSIQIYCDFAGYSILAIGAAQVMGIELIENFHAPYFAGSIKDFWRRWHISLSTWLRDYLYIPLGGSRCSKLRQYFNIMVTFLISGLWHGANWTFILWGGLHGLYQILENMLAPAGKKLATFVGINVEETGYKHLRMLLTFIATAFAWILFKAESLTQAGQYIKSMLTKWNPWVLTDGSLKTVGFYNGVEWAVVILAMIVLWYVDYIWETRQQRIDVYLDAQGNFFRILFVACMIFSIIMFGSYGGYQANAFIYFQF